MLRFKITLIFLLFFLFSCDYNSKIVFKPNNVNGLNTFISNKQNFLNFSKTIELQTGVKFIDKDSIVDIKRTLLKIRCSSIPIGSQIDSSFLYLKVSNQYNIGENTYLAVHKILEDWNINEVTWSKSPNYSPDVEFKVKISQHPRDYYKLNTTEFVKGFIKGDYQNYGFLIKLIDETKNGSINFYSCNAREKDNWPKLVVYYK